MQTITSNLHWLELDKCILLCSNCHSEVHEGITDVPEAEVV